jgi:hypothetical protein
MVRYQAPVTDAVPHQTCRVQEEVCCGKAELELFYKVTHPVDWTLRDKVETTGKRFSQQNKLPGP